jgi:hypothetical protein
MKVLKGIGTALILAVLIASVALTLVSGAVRFMTVNPWYLKTFVPTGSYCADMRERLGDDLDHIALLYGLEEGALSEVVTDDAIKAYTGTMIDALLAEDATAPLALPAFPKEGFADWMHTHTGYSEQGVSDFSEDCAQAVTEDLGAINTTLIIEPFLAFRDHTFTRASLILFIAGLLLVILMLVFLKLMYLGKSKRTGSVLIWGGCFMGVTVVFVPVMQFLLFDYIGRLNISVSAFRTALTGFLNTVLYGWFFILLGLEVLSFILLLVAITRWSGQKRKRKAAKNE